MPKPYKQNGQGTVWFPRKDDERDRDEVIQSLKEGYEEEGPDFGSYDPGTFETEEIYVDNHGKGGPEIHVSGSIEGVFISLSIPIQPGDDGMKTCVQDLNEIVDISSRGNDINIHLENVEQYRTKTTDAQGRFNLGTDYAGQDVHVIVLNPVSNITTEKTGEQ